MPRDLHPARGDGCVDEAVVAGPIGAAEGLPITLHEAFDETPDLVEA